MAAAVVGARVVRGPSWDYGDQDGGEGIVGTVVEIGKGCFEGWVVVQWDYGSRARYRIGRDKSEHDLLLLDSACTGVHHRGVWCDGQCTPSESGYVSGIRWKCAHCSDFDLCTECYMNNVHDTEDHTFVRINTQGATPVHIPSRRNATKVLMRGLFQGATVKRSRFWQGDKEDGLGDIIGFTGSGDERAAEVRWRRNKETSKYRIGGKSIPELTCTADGVNRHYYKDHLPVFGAGGLAQEENKESKRTTNSKETKFSPGDRVAITVSLGTLLSMGLSKESYKHVKELTGKIGFVQRTTQSDAHVVYQDGQVEILPFAVMEKVPDITKGDKVRIRSDKALVKRLLPGHGGWNDNMKKDLGKSAKVVKVDSDGDIAVKTRQRRWTFHPCCLEVIKKNAYTKDDSDSDDDGVTLKGLGGEALLKLLAGGGGESIGGDVLHKLLRQLASDSDKSDSSDSDGEASPDTKRFHVAAALGNVSMVTKMLSQDPHLLSSKYKNQTALFAAIGHNEPDVVRALVEAGADVTQRSGKLKGTVLHHATEGGYMDILTYLLPLCGAILNARADEGLTPLHVATLRNQTDCGKILLLYGCNPNEKDIKGNTPLLAGMEKSHDDLEFLFEVENLDVTSTNKKGFNALHQAVFHNRRKTARLLLNRFPTLGPTLASSQSTLHIAAINNYAEMLEILLKDGSVDINVLNGNKETPLHLAVQEGCSECVELLLAHGANINAKSRKGDTPLHMAVRLNANDKKVKDTPTLSELKLKFSQHGVSSNTDALLVLLVNNGAKTDERDRRSKTPLDFIKNENLKDLLERLFLGQSLVLEPAKEEPVVLNDGKGFVRHIFADIVNGEAPQAFEGVHRVDPEEIRLEECIGEGAFGKVHRAVWRGTPVAVKVLSTRKNQKHDVEREISVHKRTRHPNIVRMMALSYKDNETLLVMQLVEGSNLQDLLFSNSHLFKISLTKAEKVQISLEILQAIRFLHESKILHLDIKPSNIIVEKSSKKAYLCDLGLAHMKSRDSAEDTKPGVRGTIYYMPPECLKGGLRRRDRGDSKMTSASDIWSLGCTLLELFTEKPLWGDGDNALLRIMGTHSQPSNLRRADSDIKRILTPCFEEDPNERPSAAQLMTRFQELGY